MRLAICVVFLLALFGVNASEEQKLLELETTGQDIELDAELRLSISGKNLSAQGLSIFDFGDNTSKSFDVSKLKKGAVLKKEEGRNVIVLKSENFNPNAGGDFKVLYLRNGIKNQVKSIPLQMIKVSGEYRWAVFSAGREVRGLNLIIKKFLGRDIGVDKIALLYK